MRCYKTSAVEWKTASPPTRSERLPWDTRNGIQRTKSDRSAVCFPPSPADQNEIQSSWRHNGGAAVAAAALTGAVIRCQPHGFVAGACSSGSSDSAASAGVGAHRNRDVGSRLAMGGAMTRLSAMMLSLLDTANTTIEDRVDTRAGAMHSSGSTRQQLAARRNHTNNRRIGSRADTRAVRTSVTATADSGALSRRSGSC